MTEPADPLLLSRHDVTRLLDLDACISAVEEAFRLHATGEAPAPAVLNYHVMHGGFHVKAGALDTGRHWFAAKVNANFPGNPARYGLPTIQGALLLFDADSGVVLSIMDSQALTVLRTAAATAVAVRHLTRDEPVVAGLVGCGAQGGAQLAAVSRVRRVRRVAVYDIDTRRAESCAVATRTALGATVDIASDARQAALAADVLVTATPASRAFIGPGDVRAGTFIAAVGADNASKQEIDPELLAQSVIITDVTDQAATMGDLHHAIASGLLTARDVFAELGDIVAGLTPMPATDGRIVVFDSTGMALQDVAAASVVYERAMAEGAGRRFGLHA